jgi:LCP family protein required for cell wall assembly
MKKTFVVITMLLVCLAAAIGFGISIAARIALLDVFFSLTPTAPIMGEANILVLGLDGAGGVRSDTIMVLHIDPEKKDASLLSIPRDTIVTIPGRGLDKVNAANAYGGVELARRTVEDFLQVEIPYYITVNLAEISALIDQLGGVTINVEKRMYYVDYAGDLHIDLQPGVQKLNGQQAMGYLRFRHTDNDFKRIGRQQQFVSAVAAEIMRKENLIRSPNLFISLLQCVQTNLTSRQVLGLALALRGVLELHQFSMNMVPGSDLMVDNIYYWKPDEAQVKLLVDRHLAKKRLAATPGE